jgi:hypothetical protein
MNLIFVNHVADASFKISKSSNMRFEFCIKLVNIGTY